MKTEYFLNVHNTTTGRNEDVIVDKNIYNIYRRTGWKIENNDRSFYRHEIQFTALVGGEDGSFERPEPRPSAVMPESEAGSQSGVIVDKF